MYWTGTKIAINKNNKNGMRIFLAKEYGYESFSDWLKHNNIAL